MAMKYYSTIQELIDSVSGLEISYRNLHTNAYIENKGTVIKIPYKSIIRDYLPYLKQTCVTSAFTDLEKLKYRFKPKMLSNDLYETTELWSALLEINGFISLLDFTLDKPILVFAPKPLKRILNEVMILEEIIK